MIIRISISPLAQSLKISQNFRKTRIIIPAFIFLLLASCNNSKTGDEQKNDTPKALEDKTDSYSLVSKRSYDDLVESLYKELADKTPELKELENKMENLSKSKDDSSNLFDQYNGKNGSYYSSADNHIVQIKDSVLRDKIKNLIANSLIKYNSLVSRHNSILKSIQTKNLVLNDLHTILKITSTLPLIEKYQKDNLPTTKSLSEFAKVCSQIVCGVT